MDNMLIAGNVSSTGGLIGIEQVSKALLRWREWDRPAAVEAGFLKLRWRAR